MRTPFPRKRGGAGRGSKRSCDYGGGKRGTVASVSTATSAPSCPLFASSLLRSAPLRLLSSLPHSASPRFRDSRFLTAHFPAPPTFALPSPRVRASPPPI